VNFTPAKRVKYIAEISGGREVTLVCAADYDYWQSRAAIEQLTIANVKGAAEIWLSAVQLRWMGVRFNELSISVRLDGDDSALLIAAFNTSRLFALSERLFFSTPYRQERVEVIAQSPEQFALYDGVKPALSARRGSAAESQLRDKVWQGTIWLPSSQPGMSRKHFYARLGGGTQVAPFDAMSDELDLRPSRHAITQSLVESGIRGVEWRVRPNANHARSKTFTE
jgi:hypothetical protein